jgi:hypothetical protein
VARAPEAAAGHGPSRCSHGRLGAVAAGLALLFVTAGALAQAPEPGRPGNAFPQRRDLPPRVKQAERFLARRGLAASHLRGAPPAGGNAHSQAAGTPTWKPIGPIAVQSLSYELVTGRVSALALDPSDTSGNRLYLGATGGGVWVAQNAGTANPANVVFLPLTDSVAALSGSPDASISIGALSVQPGGTGVILAGTGDPNDALDSYYGAGILRSADGGKSWSLIAESSDTVVGQEQNYSFSGEGFAGFAWSTLNPQLVVAAVSQAYEGTLVDAIDPMTSYQGLYYSSDGGATWHLARITDGGSNDVQGPASLFVQPDGNAATAVVWNPVRGMFVAAVRFHGYYQSFDGVTWTRMAAQPGTGLTTQLCPTNPGITGSPACPIFRGALAVNPVSGDTFAWTVDLDNQDQGLWQDQCAIAGGACTNLNVTFATQLNTKPLEANTLNGPATIENGDYNLTLAAVPSQQDTLLLAGANDLWKCSIVNGCVWRNTTNANTCMSATVGGYQHALAWSAAVPTEVFVGNDSGIWRSLDAIGETGAVCNSTDASHFQNLNGSLGSLAEPESMAQISATPYTMLLGLGVSGTAGINATAVVSDWPTVLGGEGGPVANNPGNSAAWYANNGAGVSIHACFETGGCTPAAFGVSPAITDADVGGDGLTMTAPAPFLVDPLDTSQLVIGTCRVWRGPASGSGWSAANAVSPILDGNTGNTACSGDALIRSMAALATPGSSEKIYLGMYGALDGGATLAGHLFGASVNASGAISPGWQDLSLNPVTNDANGMNVNGLDVSSIFIDPHDQTGNTVYVTVAGFNSPFIRVATVYRSTDGGAHWANLSSNLPAAPANSLAVDPQDANTVYVATDAGVYSTRQVASCAASASVCWSAFGSGLPEAPVVLLAASPVASTAHLLTAATYGRGVWANPLWTASNFNTTATALPASLTFAKQVYGTASAAQTVTLTNTGSFPLSASIAMSGDFTETDNCQAAPLAAAAKCTLQVTFTPTAVGSRTGMMTIFANVSGGQIGVALSGTAVAPGAVSLLPASIAFGTVKVGTASPALEITAANSGGVAVAISATTATGPFSIASNVCGSSLAAGSECQIKVQFSPAQAGAAAGTFTMTDAAGTQTVQLSGTGAAPPTDVLSAASLAFPATVESQLSAAMVVTLTNNGGVPLTSIAVAATGPFQAAQNCGTSLAAQSSCAISVKFAPIQLGAQTGTLKVTDLLRSQTVALSGTGVKPGAFTPSPASLAFATQKVGTTSAPATLTISNTGGAPIANVGFQISGENAGSFSAGATTCGVSLANGSSCTLQVTFDPATTGGSAALLTISSSSVGVAQATVPLSGAGATTTSLGVSPVQLSFPVVVTGQSSAAQTVTITDTGLLPVTPLSLAVNGPFSLAKTTCAGSLAAGAKCTASIVFTPSALGQVTGGLTVSSPSIAAPATVALTGTGGSPPGILLAPGLINFPATGAGLTGTPVTVTISNPGSLTGLTGLTLAVKGSFRLVNDTCLSTLGPKASCTTGVAFAPLSAGAQTGSLSVTTPTVPGGFVALDGMGFDFTVTPTGATSLTVSNGQTASYKLVIATLDGSQGAFTFQCGSVPPNALCIFNPTSEGVTAGATGFVTVQVATGQGLDLGRLKRPGEWRIVPLACGLALLPLAWRKRRRSLFLAALLAVLAGGVSSCVGASGGSGGEQHPTGPGITPPATYSIPVTALSNGLQHSVTLSLTVD